MNGLPLDILVFAQAAFPEGSDVWSNTFFGLDPDKRFVLMLVAIGCSVGIILGTLGILSGTINAVHRRRVEADIKREMIERGMSADEITKIIESVAPPEDAIERRIAAFGGKKK